MADDGYIARIKPGAIGYTRRGATEKIQDWSFGPGSSMKNFDEYMRPLRPGEQMNLREEEPSQAYARGGPVLPRTVGAFKDHTTLFKRRK